MKKQQHIMTHKHTHNSEQEHKNQEKCIALYLTSSHCCCETVSCGQHHMHTYTHAKEKHEQNRNLMHIRALQKCHQCNTTIKHSLFSKEALFLPLLCTPFTLRDEVADCSHRTGDCTMQNICP